MKERIFLRSIALLVAIVLTVTFTFSNYSFVNAAENDTTTEVQTEKELVQYDDDWVIFKYKDENGEPTFDIKYQGKTVEELKQKGFQLQYFIIVEGNPMPFYIDKWFNIEEKAKLDFLKNKYEILFRVIHSDKTTILSTSDAFTLKDDNNLSAYVSHSNIGYYYDLTMKPNKFKLELKVNKYLEQIEDLSISVIPDGYGVSVDNIISSTRISNISLNSYSNNYNIEGKTYKLDYSIISCDIDIPSSLNDPLKFDPDTGEAYKYMVGYTFSFNGFSHLIEDFLLVTNTPTFYDNKLIEFIQINAPSANIKAGNSISLTTNILPDNATNKKLNWYSSNEEYATVDENGIVTAKSAGAGKTVTITAKATDGSNIEGSYTLNIENNSIKPKDILVQSIKITAPSTKVPAGKTINLKASVNSDATNKSIVWSSSNTNYATVNSSGIVTTKKAGAGKTVTITAKATDGSGKIATFKLKINKVLVNKIKLKAKKSVKVGKKLKIKLTVNSDATNKAVKWSVSNKKYAKINSKGILTAKKAGIGKTIKITAKAKDGSGKKTTIKIKIKK